MVQDHHNRKAAQDEQTNTENEQVRHKSVKRTNKGVNLPRLKKSNRSSEMTVMNHIYELRKRLIVTLALFVVSMAVGFFLAGDVIRFLQSQPVAQRIEMAVFDVTDAFKVYFQFSIVVGLVFTFPLALYQIWTFVSPGLKEKERKVTLAYIPGATILFVAGIVFSYMWLFPFIVNFMVGIAERLDAQEVYGMAQYFRFLFSFVVPFGFLFQMPLLIFFLTRLGVITPDFLRRTRKYAYFILFVLAAVITPPELMSHVVVTLPLILLYEFSFFLSRVSYRKKNEPETRTEGDQA
jgi:sec-independent protein translocase protein TatC